LTKWEGTRWAKERFEREQGVIIRDTTSDGISDWVEPELRVASVPHAMRADIEDMENIQEDEEAEENEMDEDGEDSDTEIQSVGVELNERLRAAVAQREAGNTGTVMDEEWEQWLKDAVEAGGIPFLNSDLGLSPHANIPGTRPAPQHSMHPTRSGQWNQIPEFLHNIVRQNIEAANNRRLEDTSSTASQASSSSYPSRSAPSPRYRAAPPTTSSSSYTRVDGRQDRLASHYADVFTRRPITGTHTMQLPTIRARRSNVGISRGPEQGTAP